ncbi:hypothetical protein B0H11DRAFT_1924983 [Mycena galericulata]|nr:hypothetical protein B0H11DRAFT_1924983 [Mycena galericulata]
MPRDEIWRLRDVRRDAAKYPMVLRYQFRADLAIVIAQAIMNLLEYLNWAPFLPRKTVILPDSRVKDRWRAKGVLWYPARFIKHHPCTRNPKNESEFHYLECIQWALTEDDLLRPSGYYRQELGFQKECCPPMPCNLSSTAPEPTVMDYRIPHLSSRIHFESIVAQTFGKEEDLGYEGRTFHQLPTVQKN